MGRDHRAEEQGENVRKPSDGLVRMGCSRGESKIDRKQHQITTEKSHHNEIIVITTTVN
jgi:hypothetical protein